MRLQECELEGATTTIPTIRRILMSTKEQKNNTCYENAKQDEPMFTLIARDKLAPEIVREWAYRALASGTPIEKVTEARRVADEMENWQIKNGTRKVPD